MDEIIKIICDVLSKFLNVIILIAGIGELVLLCISWHKLYKSKNAFMKLSKATKATTEEVIDKQVDLTIKQKTTIETELDWIAFDKLKEEYQSTNGIYSIYSLIIQLFTLLGILGTVAGLFIAMQNWSDSSKATEMYDGIKFALSSTVLGIIFAVIYKIFDIVLCSQYINYIDDEIERFDKNYTRAKDRAKDSLTTNNSNIHEVVSGE